MRKHEFLAQLRVGLAGMPQVDIEERLNFYSEMIDDRMEEGFSEEDAVREVGSVDVIVAQILDETSSAKTTKGKMTQWRKLKPWEIVLLALGSPIWLSLLIAVVAVAFSVYIVLWSAVVSLWAVEVSLWGCAVGFVAGGIALAISGHVLTGVALLGAAVVLAGLSIFLFYGCKMTTKGIILLSGKIVRMCFAGKENA